MEKKDVLLLLQQDEFGELFEDVLKNFDVGSLTWIRDSAKLPVGSGYFDAFAVVFMSHTFAGNKQDTSALIREIRKESTVPIAMFVHFDTNETAFAHLVAGANFAVYTWNKYERRDAMCVLAEGIVDELQQGHQKVSI